METRPVFTGSVAVPRVSGGCGRPSKDAAPCVVDGTRCRRSFARVYRRAHWPRHTLFHLKSQVLPTRLRQDVLYVRLLLPQITLGDLFTDQEPGARRSSKTHSWSHS